MEAGSMIVDGSTDGRDHSPGLPVLPLFVVLIGSFMAILDMSIVNVAIPHIMNEFGAATDRVQWVVTIYALAMGVVVPFSGWASDRFGSKTVYVFSLVAFTVGSVLSGLAWNVTSLSAFRVAQALGGGLIQPVAMAMVFRMAPRERIGSAMGVIGLAVLLAPALGPTLGGYLVEYWDWRWVFMINIPIGMVGVLSALTVLPAFPPENPRRVDWVGGLAVAGGLFTLLLALSRGQAWGWRSEPVVLLLYSSLVLLGFFVWWELRCPEPLVNLRILRHATFSLSLVMSFALTTGMFAGLFFVPLFLQNIRGLSPLTTGLVLMPQALVTGLMMPLSGSLYDRIGPRPLLAAGIALIGYATYLMHNLAVDTPTSVIVGWMMLRGIGMGLAMMPAFTAGMSVLSSGDVNAGSSLQNVIQRVGGSFGIAALTSVLVSRQALYVEAYRSGLTPDNQGLQAVLASVMGATDRGAEAMQGVMFQLFGAVMRGASVSAMDDLFVITAVVVVVAIVPAMFLRARYGPGARRAFPGAEG